MATVKYRVKDSKKNPTPVYVRFRHGIEHDYEMPTGIVVFKEHWSKAKEQIKLSDKSTDVFDIVNPKLRDFKNCILDQFSISQANGVTINKAWLENVLQVFFNRTVGNTAENKSIYFSDFAEWHINRAKVELIPKTSKPRSIRTIQDYNTTLKKLKHYEKVKNVRLKHLDVDRNFHRDFIAYCQEYHKNNYKTIGGEIDNIRLFLRQAELEGYKVSKDYEKGLLFSPDNETHDIAFTTDDIQKIANHDFSENERLDNARDWLVIGIWTGLRVSDLLNLSEKDVNDDFFELENRKTGIFVVIPIHEDVQKILDKRKGFPRKISCQKFNDYIKEVAEVVGLVVMVKGSRKVETVVKGYKDKPVTEYRKKVDMYPKYELVSSHICRRTFATYHYGKLDTLTIMKITGHKTEKQFLEYVKITPRQHAEKMKEMWQNMQKNERRQFRRKRMP